MAPQPPAPTADEVTAPGKALRVGLMAKHLLDELRHAPLDLAGRKRLREAHDRTLVELSDALSPALRIELGALTGPFDDATEPSSSELRVAHAQLVGWLEGLFVGVRASASAQQLRIIQQLEDYGEMPSRVSESTPHGTYL